MIVYHTDGRVIAWHADHQDAPSGSYPGTARRVVPDPAALTQDEAGETWLAESWRAPHADNVRAEAGWRIYARYPVHAQLNMLARASELAAIGIANWSVAEAAEAAGLQASREWIAAIRAASDAMEAAPPADYADDARWPA